MPVVIPTPEEMVRLSWKQQANARRTARLALEALHRVEVESDEKLNAIWDRQVELTNWALHVRAEARAMLAEMPPDPDVELHRAQLLEAVK